MSGRPRDPLFCCAFLFSCDEVQEVPETSEKADVLSKHPAQGQRSESESGLWCCNSVIETAQRDPGGGGVLEKPLIPTPKHLQKKLVRRPHQDKMSSQLFFCVHSHSPGTTTLLCELHIIPDSSGTFLLCSPALCMCVCVCVSRVSIQKSKWDSSRSMRYNQDAQREEGTAAILHPLLIIYYYSLTR